MRSGQAPGKSECNTLRMPLPPPPQEALSMRGYPILAQHASAWSRFAMQACTASTRKVRSSSATTPVAERREQDGRWQEA